MFKQSGIYFFILFLFVALPAYSQQDTAAGRVPGIPDRIGADMNRAPSLSYLRDKAQSSYKNADYGRSAKYYEMILDSRPKDVDALVGLANAAYRNTKYDKAAWACEMLLDSNLLEKQDGVTELLLANIYYCQGKFDRARTWYDFIEALPGVSKETKKQADIGLEKCSIAEAALEQMQMPGVRRINVDTIPRRVRTKYSEYAPVWVGDSLLHYTTYGGFPYREDERVPQRRPMRVVLAEPSGDSMRVWDAGINEENKHTAYTALNADRSVLYYAVGKNQNNDKIRFELYRRKRTSGNDWGLAERLPDKINVKNFTTTQPNIGKLPGEETETLFFVSDRPGGKGGKDIWFCRIQNDTFSEPQNLSSLNTAGDDVSPFYYPNAKTLYFSSNGFPQTGMGGFDIMQVGYMEKGWDTLITALPPPLNSGANDIFYTRPDCSNMAFFSSNRNGAINFSDEDCCYDLFRVEMVKPEFVAVTFYEGTADSLYGTTMRLVDLSGNSPQERVDVPGAYRGFDLQPNVKYMLIATKPGFIPDTMYYDMPRSVWKCGAVVHLYLRPIKINLIASVVDCKTGEQIPGALFKFYKRRSDINDVAGALSDSTTVTGNTREYKLDFDRRYRLVISKEGYTSLAGNPDTAATAVTENIQSDTTLYIQVCLNLGFPLEVSVKSECKDILLQEVNIQLTDLKTGVTTEYFTGTDSVYIIPIQYDTRYELAVSKQGYTSIAGKSDYVFQTNDIPRRPRMVVNTLRLMPPLPECLPIVLYFHNDEPGPHTRKDTMTSEPYDLTYLGRDGRNAVIGYSDRKDEYLKNCERDSVQLMQDFLDNVVSREWDKLFNISTYLYDYLDSFNDSSVQVVITLKGYASPLGNVPYNLSLSKRRVKSVENYFMGIEGSILQLFMADSTLKRNLTPRKKNRERLTSEARLDIRLEKFGAATPLDKKFQKGPLAIYSVSAARQRRVEVVGIEMIPNKIGALSRTSPPQRLPHDKDPKP